MQSERSNDTLSSASTSPHGEAADSWILTTDEPSHTPLYLANGYMSISLDPTGGFLPGPSPSQCFVRGVYSDTGPGGVDRLTAIPNWSRVQYGEPCTIVDYQRALDLSTGTVRTRFTVEEARGRVDVDHVIFVSREDQHGAAVRLVLTPHFDGPITLRTELAAPEASNLRTEKVQAVGRAIEYGGRTAPYGVAIAERVRFVEDEWEVQTCVAEGAIHADACRAGRVGQPLTLTLLISVVTSLEAEDPSVIAWEEGAAYDDVLACHRAAWARLWQTDIEIEGDPDVQRFARAALFSLWSSVREDDRWSIAPMGLSSTFYNGHIFWDAELWMYPPLLVTHPGMGKSCVAYREWTMQPARERATSNGNRGAQYPWEAAFTGEEMTPTWAETRDFQIHITADVAIGQWWYYLNTGDLEWLRSHGYGVIRECAEYWASRVEHDVARSRYVISNVVCADEYAEHVDNDAFTNAAVRAALIIAARAADLLGEEYPREWCEIAERIYIPFDDETGCHLEYDGFDGRITKQADVELLAYPLEHSTDPDQIARDLDYYATVIDPNGPAMSFSVYSVLSAQLGRLQAAYDYLKRAYVPNTQQPFYAFSETPENGEYYFCTGAGGALQALLFGFSGLRLREGYFVLAPRLAPSWTSLRLRNLFVLGARTDIEITREGTLLRRHLDGTLVTLRLSPGMDGRCVVEITWDDGVERHVGVQPEGKPGAVQTAHSTDRTQCEIEAGEPVCISLAETGEPPLLHVLLRP